LLIAASFLSHAKHVSQRSFNFVDAAGTDEQEHAFGLARIVGVGA
jgi:hypothetical protein